MSSSTPINKALRLGALCLILILSLLSLSSTTVAASSPQKLINDLIDSHPLFVASKSYCPYCRRVKLLMQEWGVEYAYNDAEDRNSKALVIELDQRDDGAALQGALMEKSGSRTVPSVWMNGKFVNGGSDAFMRMASNGEWKAFLEENDIKFQDPSEQERQEL